MIEVRGLTNTALLPTAPRRVIIRAFQTTRRRGLLTSAAAASAQPPVTASRMLAARMGSVPEQTTAQVCWYLYQWVAWHSGPQPYAPLPANLVAA
jgi:hypothetical protein